ncbi:MAG: TonB-dependent receptor, partial [Sphingomonas sp.]
VFIFHTRDPNLEKVEYSAETEVSQTKGAGDMNYGLAGAVSVPIIKDKLALRISGGHSRNPGWADAYYGPFDGTPDEEDVNGAKNDDLR